MNYVFSFFSGAGLWDYAIKEKFKIVRTNEINKAFFAGYNGTSILGNCDINFEEFINNQKLNNFLKNEINIFKKSGMVGFIGGSPCIDFSIAGKNLGKDGIHGKLLSKFIYLINDCDVDFFIIENVPNLIHNRHFEYFISSYVKLNYNFICSYVKLNALEFGVPQNRTRVFIYGINKKIKNKLTININDFKKYNLEDIKKIKWPKTNEFNSPIDVPNDIIYELTCDYAWKNLKNHPNSKHFFSQKIHQDTTLKEGERRKQSATRYHRYKYANTLCFGDGRNIPAHPTLKRSISVSECLAIQSLPINFILPDTMSITNMYRVISNGVPFELGRAISNLIHYEFL